MPDLLIELLSEEMPARLQPRAAADLRSRMTGGLVEAGLTYAGAAAFAGPRRLTLAVEGLSAQSAPQREERRGPKVGAPEAALAGFERSTGVARDAMERRADKKGEVWFAVTTRPGRPAAQIVAEVLEAVIRGFPWPVSMRWGAGSLRWVRPLHGILCILSDETGTEAVPLELDGIVAGGRTWGHRFMAPAAFSVVSFEDYAAKLRKAFVEIDAETRAARIENDAVQAAFALGLEVVPDASLIAEIAGLVEWPVVHLGRIEPRFLDLPAEVLRVSMRMHQKFPALRDPGSGRIEGYVVVADRETADGGAAIRAGNARVLAARLADAAFFWANDCATPLEAMAARLGAVTFHARLGTQAERVERIAALAREIAPLVGADPDLAARAGQLAKADLTSQMVYEFPELQGLMGRLHAERAGEDPAVAAAIHEHYAPLGPSDAVPRAEVSVAVALADKIDTLTGFWVIGEKPTGSKDPFALRRAALGVCRCVVESRCRIGLYMVVRNSISQVFYARSSTEVDKFGELRIRILEKSELRTGIVLRSPRFAVERKGLFQFPYDFEAAWKEFQEGGYAESFVSDEAIDLLNFLHDRLKVYLRDDGIRHDVIDAGLALPGSDDLVLVVARVRALQAFLATEDGANLLAGFRRTANILEIEQKKDGVEYSLDPEPALAQTDAERALFAALDAAEADLGPALEREDFAAAMTVLARLRAPIDAFFETTVVNAEAPMVRRNRLCLLERIRGVMGRVAAFSRIEGG